MADCWRPAEERLPRRDHQPPPSPSNVTRRDEGSSSRPPLGPRSHSMDQNARRPQPASDPRKRVPSRSPDGGQARKQPRPDPGNMNGLAPSGPGAQRRSSVSNGTPRQASTGFASPQDPRPGAPSAKEMNGFPANSADRRASFGGAANEGLTLNQRGRGVQPTNPVATTRIQESDVTMKDNVPDADSEMLLGQLAGFASHISVQAALQIDRDQAKTRFDRAQLEYHELRKQFDIYPAIKERKTSDRAAAQKDLEDKEAKLSEHRASQNKTLAILAKLLGQTTAKNAAAERAHFVSRAEFDALSSKCDSLKSEVDATKKSQESLRAEINEVNIKAGQVTTFQGKIDALQNNVDALQGFQGGLDQAMQETKKLRDDFNRAKEEDGRDKGIYDQDKDRVEAKIDRVRDASETTRKRLDALSADLKKYATKEDVVSLETEQENLTQEVAGVKKKNAEMFKDVGQMKLDKRVSGLPKSPADVVLQRVESLGKEVMDFKIFILGKGHEDSGVEKQGKITEPTAQLESPSGNNGLDALGERVGGPGSVPGVQPPQVQGWGKLSLISRVEEIEERIYEFTGQAVLKDEAGKRDELIITHVEDQLELIRADFREFRDWLTAQFAQLKDDRGGNGRIANTTDTTSGPPNLNPVSAQLKQLRDDYEGRDHTVNAALSRLDEEVIAIKQMVDLKVSSQTFAAFQSAFRNTLNQIQNDCKSLNSMYQELQAAIVRSNQASTSTSAPSGATLYQGGHLANGISPQPQNGTASPSTAGGPVQPSMDYTAAIRAVNDRCDALVLITNHLKQRSDNLTTDEIAQKMVDQASVMFPYAKNFDTEMRENAERQQKVNQTSSEAIASSKAASNTAERASKTAHEANETASMLMRELEKSKKDLAFLSSKGVPDAVATLPVWQRSNAADIDGLQKRLNRVSALAQAADTLSKETQVVLLGWDAESLNRMWEQVDQLQERVDGHDNTIREGKEMFRQVNTKFATLEEKLDTLENELATCAGNVAGMEELLK